MTNHTVYKINKTKLHWIVLRIEFAIGLHIVSGPQYIRLILKRIELLKQLFIMELEQGKAVKIPPCLS